MDRIIVRGGKRLAGEVQVSGAKNSALPILVSSLLTSERCVYSGIPDLVDIHTTVKLLSRLGAEVFFGGKGSLTVAAKEIRNFEAPYDLVKTMRASFLVLGPLLARFGGARVSTPGGCAIGARPVNLHLKGLAEMGATIEHAHGYIEAKCRKLRGAKIYLDLPSVGATEHLMMAATLAKGTTVIENAAREPEVADLAQALSKMGAQVEGAGTPIVKITGVMELRGVSYEVIPDRIEAGSFMVAAALTRGDVVVRGARADHLDAFLLKLQETGAAVAIEDGLIRVQGSERIRGVDVTTLPYPGFPTDLQAQWMALMAVADGVSVLTETIFENRFMHGQELRRMGANVQLEGNRAIVKGVKRLSGAPVMATDLRASMSLILAGLAAEGESDISRVYHLDRGYEHFEDKLSSLGADVRRVKG